jgi:outer membrane murein-binding lipoprotein Lpp
MTNVRKVSHVGIALGVLVLAGCASEMASTAPQTMASNQQQCEQAGNRWVATLGTCEVEGGKGGSK